MIIFLTVGMHEQPLDRLIDLAGSFSGESVVTQYGYSRKPSVDGVESYQFLQFDEMKEHLKRADVVITHGGTGSIIMALNAGKKPIVVPRLARYGEHVDDHQLEIVTELAARGLILSYEDGADILALARQALVKTRESDCDADSKIAKSIRLVLNQS